MKQTITRIFLLAALIVAGRLTTFAQSTATQQTSANTLIVLDTTAAALGTLVPQRGTIIFSKAQNAFYAKDYTRWVPIATLAANGLTRLGDTVKLGGKMTDLNTNLDLNSNQFTIKTGGTGKLFIGRDSMTAATAFEINVAADQIRIDTLKTISTALDTSLNFVMTLTKANAADSFGVVQKVSLNKLLGRQNVAQVITLPATGFYGSAIDSFAVIGVTPGDFVQVTVTNVAGLSTAQTPTATDAASDVAATGQVAADISGLAIVSGYVSSPGFVHLILKSGQIVTGTVNVLVSIIKGS